MKNRTLLHRHQCPQGRWDRPVRAGLHLSFGQIWSITHRREMKRSIKRCTITMRNWCTPKHPWIKKSMKNTRLMEWKKMILVRTLPLNPSSIRHPSIQLFKRSLNTQVCLPLTQEIDSKIFRGLPTPSPTPLPWWTSQTSSSRHLSAPGTWIWSR